jgi:hypothetical protein
MARLADSRPFALLAALLVAAASIASAERMAPERGTAEISFYLAAGVSLDDICGGDAPGEHRCQFCRLLAEPPEIAPSARSEHLIPGLVWQQLADLCPGSQTDDPAVYARAPPALA